MLIIEFIIFDSGLTFLWFRSSIFSFRSVRLSWFWRSLVWPFLKLRSASNFRLLYLTTRTAFLSNLIECFYQIYVGIQSFFHDLWIFYHDFQGKFWSISDFRAIFNLSKCFWGCGKSFLKQNVNGIFFILNLIIKIKMTETQNDKKWESRQIKWIQRKSYHRYWAHSNDNLNLSHYHVSIPCRALDFRKSFTLSKKNSVKTTVFMAKKF